MKIRVILPAHLRDLARTKSDEIFVEVSDRATIASTINAIETEYPALTGTIRNHATKKRRDMVRFFACAQDLSHEPCDTELPQAVQSGEEPLYIIGAIAGG